MLLCLSSVQWNHVARCFRGSALLTLSPLLAWPERDSETLVCPVSLPPPPRLWKHQTNMEGEAECCFVLPVSCHQKFVPLCPKCLVKNSHFWWGPTSSSYSCPVCWKWASWCLEGLIEWPSYPFENKKMTRVLFCPLVTTSQRTAPGSWCE